MYCMCVSPDWIALVEDDRLLARAATRALQPLAPVRVAASWIQLARHIAHAGRPALAVLDHDLGGSATGAEVARRLRVLRVRRIVYWTARPGAISPGEAAIPGVLGVVLKTDMDTLVRFVAAELSNRGE